MAVNRNEHMEEESVDLTDIDADSPLEIILEIDKRIRPSIAEVTCTADVELVRTYHAAIKRACKLFGVEFDVPDPENHYTPAGQTLFYKTKSAIDLKKIDVLYEKKSRAGSIALDEPWRDKIHTYLRIVRQRVESADLLAQFRDSILTKLHDLHEEVDRKRTRIQKFNDTLVELCAGVSRGAVELIPAVKLFERIVGAVNGARPEPEEVPSLPSPESLGLPPPEDDEELLATEIRTPPPAT
jgi:hypothetical protein